MPITSLTEEERFTIDQLRSRLKLFSGTRLLLVMKQVLAEIINEVPTIEHKGFFHQMICTAQHLLQENIDKENKAAKVVETKEYLELQSKVLRLECELKNNMHSNMLKNQEIETLRLRNIKLGEQLRKTYGEIHDTLVEVK